MGAQTAELRTLKDMLATRDADVQAMQKQIAQLQAENKSARAKHSAGADLSGQASMAADKLKEREEELQDVRRDLKVAESAAQKLKAASLEAEEALEARDRELMELRSAERAATNTTAERQMLDKELQIMRTKQDELEGQLREEKQKREEAEMQSRKLEEARAVDG